MPSTESAQSITLPIVSGNHALGRLMKVDGNGEAVFADVDDPVVGVLVEMQRVENGGEARSGRVVYSGVVTAELGDTTGVGIDVGPHISGVGTLGPSTITGAVGVLLKGGAAGDFVPVLLKTVNN